MKSLKLLSTLLLFTSLAWADSQIRIVRLSLVDGPVQLDRATGEGFDRAIMNMPVAQGMQLWTRDDSRAEVEFEDGNTIRLTPGTKVEFADLRLRDDGSRSTLIRIASGRAYVDYSKKSGEDFRVQVGNQQIALHDSVRFRADVLEGRAEFAVLSGQFDTGDGQRVKKNNTAVLDLSNGAFQLARGVTPVIEDDWDKYRTEYHDKYAKASYKGSSYYGQSDLNYYGSWLNTPYGSCWRPQGFSASWDPYSTGAWAWYPQYGYTFISAYPWGWQPFRSGSWNYVGSGGGWCWRPGGHYANYGFGNTPMYNPPAGWVPIHPPVQPPHTPPTTITGGSGGPGHRPWRGGPELIPVGDIDAATWKANHGPGPWNPGGRHHHGNENPGVATGVASGGTGVTATSQSGVTTRGSNRDQRGYSGTVDANGNNQRGYRGDRPAGIDASNRAARDAQHQQREMQHEQRQSQRESQPQRSFDRGSAPSSAPPPRMAPPPSAPAPRVSAPQQSAPRESGAHMESKTNPK